jgi:hypothetical protein
MSLVPACAMVAHAVRADDACEGRVALKQGLRSPQKGAAAQAGGTMSQLLPAQLMQRAVHNCTPTRWRVASLRSR